MATNLSSDSLRLVINKISILRTQCACTPVALLLLLLQNRLRLLNQVGHRRSGLVVVLVAEELVYDGQTTPESLILSWRRRLLVVVLRKLLLLRLLH